MVVDGHRPREDRTHAVARRLRSELAAKQLTGTAVARALGKTQPWISRRLNATVAFSVDELDLLCETLGISFNYVTAGIRALPGRPDGDDGLLLPRLDSNQQPFGYMPARLRRAHLRSIPTVDCRQTDKIPA